MNYENLLENIQQAKSFSVDNAKNTITLEFEVPGVEFNCNWSKQKVIDVISSKTLNATCDNVSMKDSNKNSIKLPIKEYVLFKTDKYDIMSVGFYRVAKDGEIV